MAAPVSRDLEDAVALHQAGRYGEALTRYRRVLAAEPDNVDALNLGGVALVQTGASDEALVLLERAAGHAAERADVHYNLGRARAELGRFRDAASAFHRAIELAPNDAQAHNNLGLVLAELGDVGGPRPHCAGRSRSSRTTPKPTKLGALLLDRGHLGEAIAEVHLALEISTSVRQSTKQWGDPQRLMRNWAAVLTGRSPDVSCEALVSDQEAEKRHIWKSAESPLGRRRAFASTRPSARCNRRAAHKCGGRCMRPRSAAGETIEATLGRFLTRLARAPTMPAGYFTSARSRGISPASERTASNGARWAR